MALTVKKSSADLDSSIALFVETLNDTIYYLYIKNAPSVSEYMNIIRITYKEAC